MTDFLNLKELGQGGRQSNVDKVGGERGTTERVQIKRGQRSLDNSLAEGRSQERLFHERAVTPQGLGHDSALVQDTPPLLSKQECDSHRGSQECGLWAGQIRACYQSCPLLDLLELSLI